MYTVKNKQSLIDVNEYINSLFETTKSFSVIRMGNMEGYFLDCFNKNEMPLEEFFYWLSLTSGVYPHDMNYLTNTWAPINYRAMVNSDMLGFVDISGHVKANQDFNNRYCNNKYTFYGVDDILALDPGYLVNKNIVDAPCENPWTRNLKGKKVLVVSNFVESINKQWQHRKEIWGDKVDDINGYELVGVVRSPFHPQMDDRQYPNSPTWDTALRAMEKEIDKYDFDVLLVSAAAWAPALANYAKLKNKIGITLCGALQLHYGIIGARWAGNNSSYTDWPNMFTDAWAWPEEVDLPKNRELFNKFERAYWK